MDIQAIARLLAQAGDNIILPALANQTTTQTKADGSLLTQTDTACQAFIREQLARMDSSISFLGEEMLGHEQQLCLDAGGTYWCLDPLDGTTNFTMGFPCFGLSLALIDHGCPVLGCIHDPVRRETFCASRGQGTWLNSHRLRATTVGNLRDCIGFIDFKRLAPELAACIAARPFYRSQRNIGTCALEWAWLAAGRAQFILHGGQKLWDYAAGMLIAEEAGYCVSDFDGLHPFEKPRLSSPIAASHPAIHARLMDLLRQV